MGSETYELCFWAVVKVLARYSCYHLLLLLLDVYGEGWAVYILLMIRLCAENVLICLRCLAGSRVNKVVSQTVALRSMWREEVVAVGSYSINELHVRRTLYVMFGG